MDEVNGTQWWYTVVETALWQQLRTMLVRVAWLGSVEPRNSITLLRMRPDMLSDMPLRSTLLASLADCDRRDTCGGALLLLLCKPLGSWPSPLELVRWERSSSAADGRRPPVRDASGLILRAASMAGSWRFLSLDLLLLRKMLLKKERRSSVGAELELAWGLAGAGPASMSASCSVMVQRL